MEQEHPIQNGDIAVATPEQMQTLEEHIKRIIRSNPKLMEMLRGI